MPERSLDSTGLSARWREAEAARNAGPAELARLLCASRERTLALLAAYEAALGPELSVPAAPQFNPPLWELGHVGWFQEYWTRRNRQRSRGIGYDPAHARADPLHEHADRLYDSSNVAHDSRWQLPLPDIAATRGYLQSVLDSTLELLRASADDDAALYFFRLALFHEDMHGEAAVYMGQALGMPLGASLRAPSSRSSATARSLHSAGGTWQLGRSGGGFAFDNELCASAVAVPAFEIDQRPERWRDYLPFVAADGYADSRWWTAEGWRWVQARGSTLPRYLRRDAPSASGEGWEGERFGEWRALDLDAPGGPVAAHRGAVGMRGDDPAGLRLGRGVGVDREPIRCVSRIRRAPVSRLFGALVRHPFGAARRRRGHHRTHRPSAIS
ncbi:MAG: DinB family protein [Betaproteobacteria bacterium]